MQNYCIKVCFLILLLMKTKPFKKQFSFQTHPTLIGNKVFYINKTVIMLKRSAECTGKSKNKTLYSCKINALNYAPSIVFFCSLVLLRECKSFYSMFFYILMVILNVKERFWRVIFSPLTFELQSVIVLINKRMIATWIHPEGRIV